MEVLRVLIADDHPLMRAALRTIIEDEPDLSVVAEVGNGRDAVLQVLALNPDVAVIDLYLPVLDGIQVIEQVATANPETRLLVLTSSMEEEKVPQAIELGALGYLFKDSDRPEILHAIREVAAGRAYLSPTVASRLAASLRRSRQPSMTTPIEPLTHREQEVLMRISLGASNAEIAHDLQIGETTVRTHVHNILQKTGFSSRSQLMMHLLGAKSRK